MKCPICNTELEVLVGGANALLGCPRCRDKATNGVWQELIDSMKEYDLCYDALVERTKELDRTQKALDIAVNMLKQIDETRSGVKENLHATNGRTLNAGNGFCWTTIDDIHNAQEQITALTKGGDNE